MTLKKEALQLREKLVALESNVVRGLTEDEQRQWEEQDRVQKNIQELIEQRERFDKELKEFKEKLEAAFARANADEAQFKAERMKELQARLAELKESIKGLVQEIAKYIQEIREKKQQRETKLEQIALNSKKIGVLDQRIRDGVDEMVGVAVVVFGRVATQFGIDAGECTISLREACRSEVRSQEEFESNVVISLQKLLPVPPTPVVSARSEDRLAVLKTHARELGNTPAGQTVFKLRQERNTAVDANVVATREVQNLTREIKDKERILTQKQEELKKKEAEVKACEAEMVRTAGRMSEKIEEAETARRSIGPKLTESSDM